jgi:GTP-binding protein
MKKIILIGRPNVGKSTLFNVLTKSRAALVHSRAGTTRDLREKKIEFNGVEYILIDSAGLENDKEFLLSQDMTKKTLDALNDVDVILFLVDGRGGINPHDEHFAKIIRKLKKPVILVANKCESTSIRQEAVADFLKLGLGVPVCISAQQRQGFDYLFDSLNKILKIEKAVECDMTCEDEATMDGCHIECSDDEVVEERPVKIAIIGKPNSGKSTLTNTIVGKEVMLTGDFPNLTRESIEHEIEKRGKKFVIIDTAGVRKQAKMKDELHKLSAYKTFETVGDANVIVLLIDINEGLNVQDLKLAEKTVEEGRPLIVVLNKDDSLDAYDKKKKVDEANDTLKRSFNQLKGISVITISALKNKGINKLLDKVLEVYEQWNFRVPTSALNAWLDEALGANPPPLSKNKTPMKVKYITQAGIRPPTFVLFVGSASDLPDNYSKYLINSIVKTFNLYGTPVRLKVNKQKNKYTT